MGDLVSRLKSEGPLIWRQLSIIQRATLVAVAIATLGVIAFLTQWAQQPEYSAVFTGLSESDASAIVTKLKELKIPYELTNGGSTVRVPSDKVYDIRLQLVSQGLPKGSTVGYELFDKMSFGLTDFAQRLNYQRALEGELSRTISRIAGVEDARVHIVLPQSELFAAKEKAATASVALKLRPGSEPDSRQVQGIATLVARSVEGLKPENVTMVDGDGNLLSGGGDAIASVGARTSSQAEAQKGFEKTIQRDVQGMLEQVLGPRKAVVRVNMLLDWDQYESSTETYSPNGKPTQVRSAKEITERSSTPLGDVTGSGIPTYPLGPAGPIGAATATPVPTAQAGATAITATAVTTTTQAATTATEPKYERREVTTNYEVSKLVEKMVKTPGAVKRQSISVMLDGQLDEATVATVTKAVGAAAGVDQARGDVVVVTSLPFDRSAATSDQQTQKDAEQRNLYFEIAKYVLAGLSILIVLLMVRSFTRGLTRGPKRVGPVNAVEARRESRALAAAAARASLPEEDPRVQLTQGEVTELAKNQPKLMAGIIKTWLDER